VNDAERLSQDPTLRLIGSEKIPAKRVVHRLTQEISRNCVFLRRRASVKCSAMSSLNPKRSSSFHRQQTTAGSYP
jgi:hypothetical protein